MFLSVFLPKFFRELKVLPKGYQEQLLAGQGLAGISKISFATKITQKRYHKILETRKALGRKGFRG